MSLKAFHVAFIALSTLLAAGFGVWALAGFLDEGGAVYLGLAATSLAAAAGLPVYGAWFLRKMKALRAAG